MKKILFIVGLLAVAFYFIKSNNTYHLDSDTTSGSYRGHKWVDLGLPSGTKWATTNVGADKPEEYGYYFAWAETEQKQKYTFTTLKYCTDKNGDFFTKYGELDNKKVLDEEDDAAATNWGKGWRTPNYPQMQELIDYCTWIFTDLGPNNGYKVVGPNGNWIFLPAAGVKNTYVYDKGYDDIGASGYYWSRNLDVDDDPYAYTLQFSVERVDYTSITIYSRCNGISIRPVLNKK